MVTLRHNNGRTEIQGEIKTVRSTVIANGDMIILLDVGYVFKNGFKDFPQTGGYFTLVYSPDFYHPVIIDFIAV